MERPPPEGGGLLLLADIRWPSRISRHASATSAGKRGAGFPSATALLFYGIPCSAEDSAN
jgi:hypothetical protein